MDVTDDLVILDIYTYNSTTGYEFKYRFYW